jgi:hypothetical protein
MPQAYSLRAFAASHLGLRPRLICGKALGLQQSARQPSEAKGFSHDKKHHPEAKGLTHISLGQRLWIAPGHHPEAKDLTHISLGQRPSVVRLTD